MGNESTPILRQAQDDEHFEPEHYKIANDVKWFARHEFKSSEDMEECLWSFLHQRFNYVRQKNENTDSKIDN